jgi:cytochrome oxidase Cu insertion factor (SCO1/SenC/PrrC family)
LKGRGWRPSGGRHVIALVGCVLGIVGAVLSPAQGQDAAPGVDALLTELGMDVPVRPFAARPFALPDLGGTTVELAQFRGRVVMLYFWTTW